MLAHKHWSMRDGADPGATGAHRTQRKAFTSAAVIHSSAAAAATRKHQARNQRADAPPYAQAVASQHTGEDHRTAAARLREPLVVDSSGPHSLGAAVAHSAEAAAGLLREPTQLMTEDLCLACRSSHATLAIARSRAASGAGSAAHLELAMAPLEPPGERVHVSTAASADSGFGVANVGGPGATEGAAAGELTGGGGGEHATQALRFMGQVMLLPTIAVLLWLLLPLESYWTFALARTVPYFMWTFFGWMLLFDMLMPGMSRVAFVVAHVVAAAGFCGFSVLVRFTMDYQDGSWQLLHAAIENGVEFAWFAWHAHSLAQAGVPNAWTTLGKCVLFKLGIVCAWYASLARHRCPWPLRSPRATRARLFACRTQLTPRRSCTAAGCLWKPLPRCGAAA